MELRLTMVTRPSWEVELSGGSRLTICDNFFTIPDEFSQCWLIITISAIDVAFE